MTTKFSYLWIASVIAVWLLLVLGLTSERVLGVLQGPHSFSRAFVSVVGSSFLLIEVGLAGLIVQEPLETFWRSRLAPSPLDDPGVQAEHKAMEDRFEKRLDETNARLDSLLNRAFDPNVLRAKYPFGYIVYATDGTRMLCDLSGAPPSLKISSDTIPVPVLTRESVTIRLPWIIKTRTTTRVGQIVRLPREEGFIAPIKGPVSDDVYTYIEVLLDTELGVSWVLGFRRI